MRALLAAAAAAAALAVTASGATTPATRNLTATGTTLSFSKKTLARPPVR